MSVSTSSSSQHRRRWNGGGGSVGYSRVTSTSTMSESRGMDYFYMVHRKSQVFRADEDTATFGDGTTTYDESTAAHDESTAAYDDDDDEGKEVRALESHLLSHIRNKRKQFLRRPRLFTFDMHALHNTPSAESYGGDAHYNGIRDASYNGMHTEADDDYYLTTDGEATKSGSKSIMIDQRVVESMKSITEIRQDVSGSAHQSHLHAGTSSISSMDTSERERESAPDDLEKSRLSYQEGEEDFSQGKAIHRRPQSALATTSFLEQRKGKDHSNHSQTSSTQGSYPLRNIPSKQVSPSVISDRLDEVMASLKQKESEEKSRLGIRPFNRARKASSSLSSSSSSGESLLDHGRDASMSLSSVSDTQKRTTAAYQRPHTTTNTTSSDKKPVEVDSVLMTRSSTLVDPGLANALSAHRARSAPITLHHPHYEHNHMPTVTRSVGDEAGSQWTEPTQDTEEAVFMGGNGGGKGAFLESAPSDEMDPDAHGHHHLPRPTSGAGVLAGRSPVFSGSDGLHGDDSLVSQGHQKQQPHHHMVASPTNITPQTTPHLTPQMTPQPSIPNIQLASSTPMTNRTASSILTQAPALPPTTQHSNMRHARPFTPPSPVAVSIYDSVSVPSYPATTAKAAIPPTPSTVPSDEDEEDKGRVSRAMKHLMRQPQDRHHHHIPESARAVVGAVGHIRRRTMSSAAPARLENFGAVETNLLKTMSQDVIHKAPREPSRPDVLSPRDVYHRLVELLSMDSDEKNHGRTRKKRAGAMTDDGHHQSHSEEIVDENLVAIKDSLAYMIQEDTYSATFPNHHSPGADSYASPLTESNRQCHHNQQDFVAVRLSGTRAKVAAGMSTKTRAASPPPIQAGFSPDSESALIDGSQPPEHHLLQKKKEKQQRQRQLQLQKTDSLSAETTSTTTTVAAGTANLSSSAIGNAAAGWGEGEARGGGDHNSNCQPLICSPSAGRLVVRECMAAGALGESVYKDDFEPIATDFCSKFNSSMFAWCSPRAAAAARGGRSHRHASSSSASCCFAGGVNSAQ